MKSPKCRWNLYLKHGRNHPSEELEDWGPDGPTLRNCIGIHATYQNFYAFFASPQDREIAEHITGWEKCEEHGLAMKVYDGFLIAKFRNGEPAYFGDWGLTQNEEASEEH